MDTDILSGKIVPRSPGFFFDPIIAHALLGNEKSKYPPLPTAKYFDAQGLRLDPPAIVKEVRALLYRGAVNISKGDVCQGERETLSFSPALHLRLFRTLSADTQTMIKNYMHSRAERDPCEMSSVSRFDSASSVSDFGSVTSAGSFAAHNQAELLILEKDREIEMLKQKLAAVTRLKRYAEGRAAHSDALARLSEQEANAKQSEVIETQKQLTAAKKREAAAKRQLYRAIYKERSKPDLGLNGRRPIEVRNICFDPKLDRNVWEKHRRDPAVAFESAWVMIQGTKEPRPFGGGLRWTVEARYEEFENFMSSGMEAARRAVFLRERALHGRALRVFLVPHGRRGCHKRNVLITSKQKKLKAEKAARTQSLRTPDVRQVSAEKLAAADEELTAEQAMNCARPLEGVRLFDHPSMRTTYREIVPTCLLLFSRLVGGVLYDESTERVGLCCDFAKSKGFGCMGAVIMVFQSVVTFRDPLGGKLYDFRVRSFTLPMTQSTNKISRELFDAEGNSLMSEAAKCLVKAMFVGNTARHFLEHPELWVLACDGAAENSGRGNAERARENLCSPGGIYWEVAITKRAWPEVMDGAERAGLRKPLDDFFGNSDVKWPDDGVRVAATDMQLDTSGPVYKNPTIVHEMQMRYVNKTTQAKNKAREDMLSELKNAAAKVQPNRPTKCFGPFRNARDKEERQKQVDILVEHESEFQLRLYRAREKSLFLYKERISMLEKSQQAPPSAVRPVSMEHNPARFLPGSCTREGGSLGEARHCGMHRSHNLTEHFVAHLNRGFLEQCVSAATYFGSEYRWPEISSAINFLLVPSLYEEISSKSRFYSSVLDRVRADVELETLIKDCEFDRAKGVQPPVTAGMARWGTAFGAAEYLDKKGPLLTNAVIKRYGHGLEETKIEACADALKPKGFISRLYPNIQIERHAERHFALITRPSDRLQSAICSFVNAVVERPLLAAISSNHECGLEAMGVNGKIRCILLVLTRDIWVRCFPHRGWGLGWNRRTTLAFRSHGAEFNAETSVRLLNPLCEGKVRLRFGEFPGMEKLVESAAKATAKLLRTITLLAQMEGQILPEDSLQFWKEANPKLAEVMAKSPDSNASARHKQFFEGQGSRAARISQAQWLVKRVAEDCVNAIVRVHGGMHRELFGISGWIARMGQSIMSPDSHKIPLPGGSTVDSQIVIPCKFAVPNAVNAFVQARDLLAHYENMGIQKGELLKRLPTYCRWWDSLEQIMGFIKQKVKFVSSDGQQMIDRDGFLIVGVPLSFFPEVDKCSRQASTCLCNSKPVESSFSPLKVVARGKGQARFALLSMLYRKRNFITAKINAKDSIVRDKNLYWKAQGLALLSGWGWVNMRDEVMGDVFRDADLKDQLQKKNKTVARGGDFANPHHGGTSRTEKYSGTASHDGRVAQRGGAGRGRKRAREEPFVGQGGGAVNGGSVGRSRKRAREEFLDVPVNSADSDVAKVQRRKERQIRKKAKPSWELGADQTAPPISQHARRCLARKKAAIEKERRRKRIEELQKERAERMELAREGRDCDCDSDGPAAVSDGGDVDYVPSSCAVVSAGGFRPNLRARPPDSGPEPPPLKRARILVPPGSEDNIVEHDAQCSGDSESGDPNLGQSGPCSTKPPSRGGRSGRTRRGGGASGRTRRGGGGRTRGGGAHERMKAAGQDNQSSSSPDSSSAPSDENSHYSDDDDLPLACRREGSVLTVTDPPVGAKIYVKWDQINWKGWFKGTVIAISDGKLAAPGGRRREVVKKGYSIVEYDDGGRSKYVHLLDEAHHVSRRGHQAYAWALLSKAADNLGSGVGRQVEPLSGDTACYGAEDEDDEPLSDKYSRGSGVRPQATAPRRSAVCDDDDDNTPLFPAAQVGASDTTVPAVSETQLRSSSGAGEAVRLCESNQPVASRQYKQNVWSLSYCFDVFDNIGYGEFRLGIAKFSAGSYTVTRQMPKKGGFPPEADIKIHVKPEQSNVRYIAYTAETGTTLFMVTMVRRPKGTDWSDTLRGYQVFATEEALTRVDEERDIERVGYATSLGAKSLRHELAFNKARNLTTYHATDWQVSMDVRCIVGVVRRADERERDRYDRQVHKSLPAKTSLIFTGLAFSGR